MTQPDALSIKTLKVRSPGKLNLTFDILGDLPGGYHEVETLMQTVSIYDEMTFTFKPSDNFSLTIDAIEFAENKSDVPVDQNNLIMKAAKLFHEQVSQKIPVLEKSYQGQVKLTKSIPVAGGMGGGSGNAAATLVVLNECFGKIFSADELGTMAAKLGADVPFFIDGGTQIGSQRGDVLRKIDSAAQLSFLIVGPKLFGMSTPEVYRAYDEDKTSNHTRISAQDCAAAMATDNPKSIAQTFGNAFETSVFARKPELKFIASRLSQLGGYCTRLTGSGPTLYVLTENDQQSRLIQSKLTEEQSSGINGWSDWPELKVSSWLATSTNSGVELLSIS